MSTRYFRAGIGTVIFNHDFEVAFFEREKHPAGIWQFQQGGIDLGESPHETLWRELMEEVGLAQDEVDLVYEVPGWTSYVDLHAFTDHSVPRIGQTHRWFFLKLKPNITIDLTRATDKEFKNWAWTTFDDAIAKTSPHKQHVYKELQEHFQTHIQKTSR